MKQIVALFVAAFLLGGCSNAQTDHMEESAKKMEQSAKTETKKLGADLAEGASEAKIKAALMASSKLDSKKIHVSKEGKTFILKGSAISKEQSELAQRIAQDTAGKDETITNELKIETETDKK